MGIVYTFTFSTEIDQYHAIIGWSTGAQVALACSTMYPLTSRRLFLFNVSLGDTLHSVFQPVVPLPASLQYVLSSLCRSLVILLTPVVDSSIWDVLQAVGGSALFRIIFDISAFCNGFPPEQGAYFHEYVRDIFRSRQHTHSLIKLIRCLDEPLPRRRRCVIGKPANSEVPVQGNVPSHVATECDCSLSESLSEVKRLYVVSAFFDFITGYYHGMALCDSLQQQTQRRKRGWYGDVGDQKKMAHTMVGEGEDEEEEGENGGCHNIASETDNRGSGSGSSSSSSRRKGRGATRVFTSSSSSSLFHGFLKHTVFSMGSHWMLLEWPDHTARLLLDFLNE
jgi:hypothetical protein